MINLRSRISQILTHKFLTSNLNLEHQRTINYLINTNKHYHHITTIHAYVATIHAYVESLVYEKGDINGNNNYQ